MSKLIVWYNSLPPSIHAAIIAALSGGIATLEPVITTGHFGSFHETAHAFFTGCAAGFLGWITKTPLFKK